MVQIEVVEVEKVVRTGNRKVGTWQERVNKEKLAELLREITQKAEELGAERAVKFSGKEFLQEVNALTGKEKATTMNSKVNEVIRKIGAEVGIWDKSKFRLVTKVDDNDVICFVSLKKKVLKEKQKE